MCVLCEVLVKASVREQLAWLEARQDRSARVVNGSSHLL